MLLAVVEAIRARVSTGFAVGVKLNSADFQKGGFDASDATQVVRWLNDLPVDLVELSGGSYESPAMAGAPADDTSDTSSARREAYFVDFARDVAAIAAMPIMATGGIRRRTVAEEALRPNGHRPGVAMIGIASAFAFEPALAARWARNEATDVAVAKSGWKPPLSSLADMALVKLQLNRVSNGLAPKPHASPLMTLAAGQLRTRQQNKRYRKWITARSVDL